MKEISRTMSMCVTALAQYTFTGQCPCVFTALPQYIFTGQSPCLFLLYPIILFQILAYAS